MAKTAAQQATTAVSVSVCWLHYDLPQTACDYHKVGMSVKGEDSWVPIEPHFQFKYLEVRDQVDPFENGHDSFFVAKNLAYVLERYLASFVTS